jgi:hypothetical protein
LGEDIVSIRYRFESVSSVLFVCASALALGAGGCASDSSASGAAPTGPVPVPLSHVEPDLKDQRIDDLLDFESPNDQVFVTAEGGLAWITTERAHSGVNSYELAPGATVLRVKLSSLMEGRAFPGDWTMIGAYFYSAHDFTVSASCDAVEGIQSRKVRVPGGQWTPVLLQLPEGVPQATTESSAAGSLVFRFSNATGAILCDDVMLADNLRVYYQPPDTTTQPVGSHWTVERRGLQLEVTSPGYFGMLMPTLQAQPDGWSVIEAGALRARFESVGPTKQLTVYEDGRAYWDGEYRPVGAAKHDSTADLSHAQLATVSLPEEQGHVDKNSAGDTDNSGYNRVTGSYRIVATGSALEITIKPNGSAVQSPVLEISHYESPTALVTVAGKVISRVDRLSDGTVLIDLPLRIERPTVVEIRSVGATQPSDNGPTTRR